MEPEPTPPPNDPEGPQTPDEILEATFDAVMTNAMFIVLQNGIRTFKESFEEG